MRRYGTAAHFSSSLPHVRLPQLRQLLEKHKNDRVIRILETHNGLTGLIAETASVEVDGKVGTDSVTPPPTRAL